MELRALMEDEECGNDRR